MEEPIKIKRKFYTTWNFWQKIMMVTFWLSFIYLVFYIYQEIDSIRDNPCSYCARKYGLTCSSFERNIYIDENGTQKPLNNPMLSPLEDINYSALNFTNTNG